MKPQTWLLLGLVLACGLFVATATATATATALAAHARGQSPQKTPTNDRAPRAERAFLVGQDSAPVVFSEYESDSRDVHSALTCWFSTTDLCAADYFLISGGSCARGGAPSLVNQGVRLQI